MIAEDVTEARAPARPAPAVPAPGEPRPARRRRGARLQQPARGDPRLRDVHRERRAASPARRDERDVGSRSAGPASAPPRLTQQLLSFARREVVRPRVLDLTGVVLEMEELLRRTLGEHVVLSTTLAPDLWPIMADHGQLEQVLVNLAVNARDAMPDGGTLTLDTENVVVDDAYASARPNLQPGRYVRLRVSDTGVGHGRADVVARAFEPFFTTKAKGDGTGLGLATVLRHRHPGGRARADLLRAGPRHDVHDPAARRPTRPVPASRRDAEPRPRRAAARRSSSSRTSRRCCEVDPADPRRATATTVLVAGGGRRGAAARRRHPATIDVLLTDVVMPEMLGKEVAARVSALRPGIRVLFMSGYAQPVIGPMGDLANGGEIVDKPFTEAALLERLRTLIASPASP